MKELIYVMRAHDSFLRIAGNAWRQNANTHQTRSIALSLSQSLIPSLAPSREKP
jgi:hypothetical protein